MAIINDHILLEGEEGIFGVDCPIEPNRTGTYEEIWASAQKIFADGQIVFCRYCKERIR